VDGLVLGKRSNLTSTLRLPDSLLQELNANDGKIRKQFLW
jgi:hypothetical protein